MELGGFLIPLSLACLVLVVEQRGEVVVVDGCEGKLEGFVDSFVGLLGLSKHPIG